MKPFNRKERTMWIVELLVVLFFIFLAGLIFVVCYASTISSNVGLINNPVLPRGEAIMTIMLTVAALIALICSIKTNAVLNAATFKSGMSACICVLGVAWLGTTFVAAHLEKINVLAVTLGFLIAPMVI